jgi:hypothetical protein
MYFYLSDISFSLKPKRVASNKNFINLIAFHILHSPFILRLSQRDIIDKDISFICCVSPAIMHPSTLRNITRGTVL